VGIAAAGIQTQLKRGPNAPRQSIARAAALFLGCAAALVSSRPTPLRAQRVDFRTESGPYIPTRISLKGGSLHLQQKLGLRFGARLTLTFSDRFDVVTGITYIPGYAMFRGAGKDIQVRTGSHLLNGGTTARYWLLSPKRLLSWEIHTGLGVGFGGQAAYQDLFESSTVSGVIGSMVRYQIGRILRLQLRLQERLFRVRFGPGDPPSNRSPFQVSFGLALPFLEALRWK
jgi:hypothetical protein